ncbi:hypothetical protein Pint_34219 [Pistacia integerrima]|uniref:Uncharacterized protein n=1 Tax=Pistacia integerrima TaxID=434235 RepID=A0ACC0X6J4_9ROSI|nr:hypothetical protein Pint_34219 [Pistacia integerrima]
MFPFMAYGHLNPFMALARQIERRKAYTITIINTPLNIQKLKSSLPPNNTNITLFEILFNVGPLQGLSRNVENTDTLSYQEIVPFMLASADLQASFRNLLVNMTEKDGCPPLCIVSDIMAAYFSISLNIHRFEADDGDEFFLPDFPEASQIQSSQLGNDLKYPDAVKAWKLGAGKSVWMIGPACSSVKKDYDLHSNDLSSWLDVHPPGGIDSEDVKRDHIAEVIKMVLGRVNKGEEIRRKASEVRVMDEFLNAATLIRNEGNVNVPYV